MCVCGGGGGAQYILFPFSIQALFLTRTNLCMLSPFSRVQLSATLWLIAHQAPLSKGFSRQEYWSGLLCPPPGDLPHPGIKPRSPALQGDSLLPDPPGKTKNIGVGSLSLLQWSFLTQELNRGPLHCRWILYQLDYQGSPTRGLPTWKSAHPSVRWSPSPLLLRQQELRG